jgi:hypothetical protein
MSLGCLGAWSTLPCTRSALGEKQTWFHKISLVQIFQICNHSLPAPYLQIGFGR